MRWKSFTVGFVVGAGLLSGISHYKARTQNVIKTWPEDYQKAMLQMAPWLKEAKVARIGPFIAMVPKSYDSTPEGMIQPARAKNPNLMVTGTTISIYDSKKRAITIDYNASTGEFISYTYIPSLLANLSFTDRRLDGSLERLEVPIRKK